MKEEEILKKLIPALKEKYIKDVKLSVEKRGKLIAVIQALEDYNSCK